MMPFTVCGSFSGHMTLLHMHEVIPPVRVFPRVSQRRDVIVIVRWSADRKREGEMVNCRDVKAAQSGIRFGTVREPRRRAKRVSGAEEERDTLTGAM